MTLRIHTIALGFDQCYVVQSEGIIAIDAGEPGKGSVFRKALSKAGIRPNEVKLLLITHGHWDHIGSAREIRDLTGAPIAMHECETHWLEESLKPLSPGLSSWGRVITRINKMIMPFVNIPAAEVDIRLGNEDFSLHEYGIPGHVIHTPGHTHGSLSVLLDSGEVFVGDLAMNRFPLCLKPGLPIFAVDEEKVKESWERLLRRGARTVYPAHGKPFPAEIMRKTLDKFES
jgi:glyoxylase-like metal-dependent hydrolase (beta-lactamase superfamily II)